MPYAPTIICYLTSTEVTEQEGKKKIITEYIHLKLHGLNERHIQGNQNSSGGKVVSTFLGFGMSLGINIC